MWRYSDYARDCLSGGYWRRQGWIKGKLDARPRGTVKMHISGEAGQTDLIAAGFILAVQYLYTDKETREKYFNDENVEFHYEFYPPLHSLPSSDEFYDGLNWKLKEAAFTSDKYSDLISEAMKDALRDGAFNPADGGYVIPVSDPKCDWWDAARHIPRFKRNMITVPRSNEDFYAWYLAGHEKRTR